MRIDESQLLEALTLTFQEIRTILGDDLAFSTPLGKSAPLPPSAHFDTHLSRVHPKALYAPPIVLSFVKFAKRPYGNGKTRFKRRKSTLDWSAKRRTQEYFFRYFSLKSPPDRVVGYFFELFATALFAGLHRPTGPLHYYHPNEAL